MPRMARAVLVGVPHHLTQRGLDRQKTFFSELDYEVYFRLVSLSASRFDETRTETRRTETRDSTLKYD